MNNANIGFFIINSSEEKNIKRKKTIHTGFFYLQPHIRKNHIYIIQILKIRIIYKNSENQISKKEKKKSMECI